MDKIKIVHTSDWHLGKKLFRNERLAEQKKYLNWLYDYLKSNSIDILLVAGDIFDIPNPPNNAQQLYFDWVYQVSNIEGLNIIIIGGNHDSSSLLNIPKQFFNDKNCFVYTGLPQKEYDNDCILNIRGKKIGVKTLPYFRNFELINQLERSHLETQENDIEDYFQHFFSQWAENVDYKILCSHHSFGSSLGSGSEHNIFLSGVESFPLNWIKDKFDYTALGHIHKKIELSKNPPIIYPGSPIAMRFSETNAKYISLITLENNQLNYEMIPIPIFRPLLSLDTNLNSLEKDLFAIIEKLNPNHLPAFL